MGRIFKEKEMQMCINCVETICLVSVKARGMDGYDILCLKKIKVRQRSNYLMNANV